MKELGGIIPALATPFDKNNKVDHGALRECVLHLIEKGVGGFYVCGSTAECFLLSCEERMAVAKTAIDAAAGKVPVAVHVGCISTAEACALAAQASADGADYISSVAPFYFSFSTDEIARYYAAVAEAAKKPMLIYNIPALSGVSLNVQSIRTITEAAEIWGMKYTSYDLFELEKIRRAFPELKLFYGHDELLVNALPVGISGAIGSTFNVMPEKYIRIRQLYAAHENEQAAALQHEVNGAIETMIACGVIPSVKYLLTRQGFAFGDCRPPFSALTEEQKARLDALL